MVQPILCRPRLWFNDVINRLDHRLYMVHTLGLHQWLQRVCTTQKSFPNFEMVHKVQHKLISHDLKSQPHSDFGLAYVKNPMLYPILIYLMERLARSVSRGFSLKISDCLKAPERRALQVRIQSNDPCRRDLGCILILASIYPIPSSPHILIIHLTKRDPSKFSIILAISPVVSRGIIRRFLYSIS